MKKINLSDKILSISHFDLDGVSAQIILNSIFKDIEFRTSTFNDIDEVLQKTNFKKYDHVFLTDIHPDDGSLLELSDNIILLDHHESFLPYHNPKQKKFVITKHCGAKLTKMFCEQYFKIDLSKFNKFIEFVNDYDMWIHKYPQSQQLNFLFWKYYDVRFKQEFANGRTNFTDSENKFIKKKEKELKEAIDNVECYPFEHINGCLIQTDIFINELCDYLLKKEEYKIVVFLTHENKGGIRHTIEGLNIGSLLEELKYGGGHKEAAGLEVVSMEEYQKRITNLEKILYKNFKEIRIQK